MTREEISKIFMSIITSKITFKYEGITEESTFDELGFDSLDLMEILMLLEEEFDINIYIDEIKLMSKLSDIIDHIFKSVNNSCVNKKQEIKNK